ncbi:tetratricopeptide repeat protein [Streptomyces sp. GMY02]|uniref:AfsR/SARP family transcriptional regulator n=1 Tax=Streptomyces sp. GMY02 TaxID=1333528 RepID=UPI001C2BEC2C|nr:BTAD domain-containing putative transcriptional regulator [Streptomyces sp. GMY02]QXE35658.1 tetratricopeptide repeat protein [Streptomyces sp. GMY02]
MIAALALHAGRPIALDTLVDYLWDDDPPPKARQNTHTYVSRARRHLRRAGEAPDAPWISHRAHTYTLDADPDSIDWHRCRRLYAEARAASHVGDDETALARLARAEGLWKGEALAGLPGTWAERERRTLSEKRLEATVSGIAASLRLGRFTELISELSALVDQHPADEGLIGHLMVACYGSGRYADALRVHQQARQSLRAEFGSNPGADLDRIHRGILDRVPVDDLIPGSVRGRTRDSGPRGSAARDTGPPAPASRPTARPMAPRNLPRQTPLVGRREELRLLSAAIDTAAGNRSLVTLETVSGMAGVGKTAIAVHAANQFAEHFPDGQLYVDLRGHSTVQEPLTAEAALALLLRLIGIPAAAIPRDLEERTALWRTMLADRRSIIVLDDAANPDQVRPLLPGDSASLTIVTSRRHLAGLPDAHPVPLDALPPGDAIALFRKFAGEERTQDIREIAGIVRLCGYLPLAIELVANRFRTRSSWTLATLGERLARSPGRLGQITDGYNSMGRAFDVSYQTLSAGQRTAFRRLGLHPGTEFGAEAAAALLDLPAAETERLLEELLTCHLILEPTPNRYRMHDLLAEYARSLAGSEDSEEDRGAALHRLTDFYIEAADQADHLAYPRRLRLTARDDESAVRPRHADEARAWFTTERGNLLAVEQYARTHGSPDRAARLGHVLAAFLDAECHWSDLSVIARHTADHWSRTGNQRALCQILVYLSETHANTAHYPEAAETGEQALAIARATRDSRAEAEALRVLGVLQWHIGENRKALALLEDSFAIKAASGDVWETARAHNNVAMMLPALEEYDQARKRFQMAAEGFRKAGDKRSLGKALSNLGDLYLHFGEIQEARRSLEEALTLLESTGNLYEKATVRTNLADFLTKIGDSRAALPLYRDSLDGFRSLGDRKSQANVLIGLGESYRVAGDQQEAAACYRDAYKIAHKIGAAHEASLALQGLTRTAPSSSSQRGATDHP